MYVKKPKKQCPRNAWVECDDEDCECCGWNPAGRTKKRERKKRTYTRHPGTKGNRKKQTNNTSGCIGVYWNGRRKKWSAEIRIEGQKKYLGSFDNLEDAIKARKEAETQVLAENN